MRFGSSTPGSLVFCSFGVAPATATATGAGGVAARSTWPTAGLAADGAGAGGSSASVEIKQAASFLVMDLVFL